MSMLTTLMIAVAVLALLFVMMSVKIVHQGYRYTIEHFGRFVRNQTGLPVLAMIETAKGVLAASSIAYEAAGLIVGTNDL